MESRRPLAVRNRSCPQRLAQAVANAGVTPNQISVLSAVWAALAGAALWFHLAHWWLLLAAAGCIQLRLICNLIDGLVAVEGGKRTKSGEVFNDLPDRFSDLFILVPTGYALSQGWQGPALGWLAASLAVMTAYIRVLGGSLGLKQDFSGPMAKQHRMAVMTAACVAGFFEATFFATNYSLWFALAVIAWGSLYTTVLRTQQIIRQLENR